MATPGARPREGTPPPIIGKAGRYTVFITPPATSKAPSSPGAGRQTPSRCLRPPPPASPGPSPRSPANPTPAKAPPSPAFPPVHPSPSHSPRSPAELAPAKAPPSTAEVSPPPVQVPPLQFGKSGPRSSNSSFGFFWDTVAKVQDAHSRLDECIAEWFGLNQSKYQWALNDYYESKGMDKEAGKTKDLVTKNQSL